MSSFVYPETKTGTQEDDFHGTKVQDPYRWLEDDVRKSKEVEEWVDKQSKLTESHLLSLPTRSLLKQKITDIWNYEKYSNIWKVADRYFYYKNDGLQNQSVLYVSDSAESTENARVLFDANSLSEDGTVSLSGIAISVDGNYLAYGLSSSGSDWVEWRVRDIRNLQDFPDLVKWVKYSHATWTSDSKGFFYARYDAPKEDEKFQVLNKYQKLYYHRLNTPQDQDVLVYHTPDHEDYGFAATVSEDGRYLVIQIWKGTDPKYKILYKDLWEPYGYPIALIDNFDNEYDFIDNDGPLFYFQTKFNAPRGRVIGIDIRKPQPEHWKEIIPQTTNTLTSVSLVGNVFIIKYLVDACTQIKVFTTSGLFIRDVSLPGIGSASGFGGARKDIITYYDFSSYAVPTSMYSYNIITGESKFLRKSAIKLDSDSFETTQVFYNSKDGTRIPMFITRNKNNKGPGPTILYGYGGFNIPMTPGFSISVSVWLNLGGTYAVACIRGGGEYGHEWHEGGKKQNKQNVFDDFIAGAEYLVKEKYTTSKQLAISGGSNGGLLVGACLVQRPDLFGACLPSVGVMDMLRFHKFTAGKFWVDDYGCSDNEDDFKNLLKYSPYHNVKKSNYPATLVFTADTDDRVVPGHSFKFAAALQKAQEGAQPVLLRIERKSGHGAGTPTTKVIEEVADKYSFLLDILKVNTPDIKWLNDK